MDNCDYLCRPCHRYFTDNPFAFTAWLASRGVDLVALEARAQVAWDKSYPTVIADLTRRIATLVEAT